MFGTGVKMYWSTNCFEEFYTCCVSNVLNCANFVFDVSFMLYSIETGTYFGGIYVYHALQCPMEAIHGRPSLWHNIISGGTIGFLGVASGRLGIPFVSADMIQYRYGISPPVAAFGVYGTISGLLAGGLGGKSF